MEAVTNIILYIFLFLSLFYQVFLLINYFEKREEIHNKKALKGNYFPNVSIIVPSWNEEHTVAATIHSLLNLNYPKDRLHILIVDDGSTDNTQSALNEFRKNSQIQIFKKKNGGKYTALNFGLKRVKTEFVGCLDADSFVEPDALQYIVPHFTNAEIMAVVPSIKIYKPTRPLHLIQNIEFTWGVFFRKILSSVGALYVTPGPFSIFRKKVFNEIGPYRHAHQTEDCEIALRMQSHHYKIVNAHNAHVFTVPMKSLYALYKQRLRWTSGFLKNAFDYRHLYFNRKYGNLGLYILPMATITIFSALYFTSVTVITAIDKIVQKIVEIQTVGLHISWKFWNFDWFYLNTAIATLLSLFLFSMTLTIILLGKRIAEQGGYVSKDMIYFLIFYPFMAPFWLAKSVYNVVFSRKLTWR